MALKSAVIGIDLGASDSYVAYVGKGIVDVVQNEVSKRSTSSLVGFTNRERLLGDSALAQIKSNAKNSCRNFKHLLGRKLDAPDVEKEHFWSTCKLVETDDGFCGYDVSFKGEAQVFSATQVTAMYLTKLKEITESWCNANVTDVVIACPSYFADVQRQALLDAAKISGLSVLRIMNEHTATALAYGIYRSNDFDPEKPMTVAFCAFGHSLFSVSIVQFVRGKLTVLCEKSDKVGGRDLDECLMREFAQQFAKKNKCDDPLSNKKSAFKLEDAVAKTKKVLSANYEAPVNCECLMEDMDFASQITRDDFEKMCGPAMARVQAVLDAVKAECSVPFDQVDSVEIIGGSSRVPWFKKMCSEAFGGKTPSTTMNQEESVARGCALQAAILSPLYKVRDFKVEDSSPFSINVGWMGSAADSAVGKEEDGDVQMGGGEGEFKTATVFPAGSMMNVLKMLTFYRNGPFDVKVEYADDKQLLPKTPKELGTFHIEVPAQTGVKKVKVKAKLSLHGTFDIEGATLVEEEEYEDTVKEKRELPPDPEEPAPEAPKEETAKSPADEADVIPSKPAEDEKAQPDADAQDKENMETNAEAEKKEGEEKKEPEKKVPEKKYEWVDVVKIKKRTKKTELKITAKNRPGLSDVVLQKCMDEETAMVAETKELIDTDARKNDLESYIFTTRDKISGEWSAFIADADRDAFSAELTKTEDWIYDTEDATKIQLIEKLDELKLVGEPAKWRHTEDGMRKDWIDAVTGTVVNYRAAGESPGDKYGHISPDKLAKIVTACAELETWLNDMKAKQEALPKHEKPVLVCADMEKKNKELAKMADEILKEPKPAPPKEEVKEEAPKEEETKEEATKDADMEQGAAPENPPAAVEEEMKVD